MSARFTEGQGNNTRDPMLLLVDGLWHCYYNAYPHRQGVDYVRTSKDLLHWSESKAVAYGGEAGASPYDAECPHVVKVDDQFYLFRTQQYGKENISRVYHSPDPNIFGINQDDRYLVCSLPVAAPELVEYNGQWYIAALREDLHGIRIARLAWK